jgi:hypothetical protein
MWLNHIDVHGDSDAIETTHQKLNEAIQLANEVLSMRNSDGLFVLKKDLSFEREHKTL